MTNFDDANCRGLDPDLFFDDYDGVEGEESNGNGYTYFYSTAPKQHAYLRRVCLTCPALQDCKEWAIKHERYGFWGGMTAMERISERRVRGIQLVEPLMMFLGRGNE